MTFTHRNVWMAVLLRSWDVSKYHLHHFYCCVFLLYLTSYLVHIRARAPALAARQRGVQAHVVASRSQHCRGAGSNRRRRSFCVLVFWQQRWRWRWRPRGARAASSWGERVNWPWSTCFLSASWPRLPICKIHFEYLVLLPLRRQLFKKGVQLKLNDNPWLSFLTLCSDCP